MQITLYSAGMLNLSLVPSLDVFIVLRYDAEVMNVENTPRQTNELYTSRSYEDCTCRKMERKLNILKLEQGMVIILICLKQLPGNYIKLKGA